MGQPGLKREVWGLGCWEPLLSLISFQCPATSPNKFFFCVFFSGYQRSREHLSPKVHLSGLPVYGLFVSLLFKYYKHKAMGFEGIGLKMTKFEPLFPYIVRLLSPTSPPISLMLFLPYIYTLWCQIYLLPLTSLSPWMNLPNTPTNFENYWVREMWQKVTKTGQNVYLFQMLFLEAICFSFTVLREKPSSFLTARRENWLNGLFLNWFLVGSCQFLNHINGYLFTWMTTHSHAWLLVHSNDYSFMWMTTCSHELSFNKRNDHLFTWTITSSHDWPLIHMNWLLIHMSD